MDDMNHTRQEVTGLVAQLRTDLGTTPDTWPGGYPDEIEAAIIDSVCSVRARYGNSPNTGVRRHVGDWRAHRGTKRLDDTAALRDFPLWNTERGDRALHQKLSGRTKAEVIGDVADRFASGGISSSADLLQHQAEARAIWFSTRGLGIATWHYVLLLLGVRTAKPDTMVLRYHERVLGRSIGPNEAVALVEAAAAEFGNSSVTATTLEHAIWSYERV